MTEKKEKILFADDEPCILRMAKAFLEDEEFEVVTVPDGETAIREIQNDTWFAVITDFNMVQGGLTGVDVARAAVAARIKRVLIISARIAEVEQIEGVRLISKPFQWKEILEILGSIE